MGLLDLNSLIVTALQEDAPQGDITTDLVCTQDFDSQARLIAKESGVFFGTQVLETLAHLDPTFSFELNKYDGEPVAPGDCVGVLSGSGRTLLKFERVLLNFIQRLSGVATQTKAFVEALGAPHIAVLDTRKTTPLYRALERQAVVAGGGKNHRYSLSDMVLLKENHLALLAAQGKLDDLDQLIRDFKSKNPGIKVEIEIDSLDQLRSLNLSSVDIIMLDNFPVEEIASCVSDIRSQGIEAAIEISGNVSLDTIGSYRDLPVDRISVGSLTHSVKALDLSLLFVEGS